jgi:hypothetical protein
MRILIAHPGPQFSVHDVHAGWVEALRQLDQQVFVFNLDDRLCLYDSAYLQIDEKQGLFRKALTADQAIELALNGLAAALFKLRPHVLFIISGFFTDHAMLDQARRQGTRIVLLATEEPYELSRHLELAPHVDLLLVNDPTNIDQLRTLVPTEYQPHAYRPTVHCPGPALADVCDLAFVGTGYESRIRFFQAMDLDGLDVVLAGNWQRLTADSPLRRFVGHDLDECVDNADAVALYRATRVGLNLYRREAERPELEAGWSCGPREIEMAATGLFFLRDPRPEGDELFPMLPTFTGPEDASELLRWCLDHPEERREAAEKARLAVADRTFAHHAAGLLRRLEHKE